MTANHVAMQPYVQSKARLQISTTAPDKTGIKSAISVEAHEDTCSDTSVISSVNHCQVRRFGLVGSLFHSRPLFGLLALGSALLLLFASFVILQVSHGQIFDEWKPWEPTVWLAIFTAISNKLIAFAAVQGVVISWWRKASRGTTLGQLQSDWTYGTHTVRALFAGRQFNALALACLCATFVAIDGPLLQRASTVNLIVPNTSVPLQVSISPEVPSYWTGGIVIQNGKNNTYTRISQLFSEVLDGYMASKTIPGSVSGCGGTCRATVLAPALATLGCYSNFHYRNFSAPLSASKAKAFNDASELGWMIGPPNDRTVYEIGPSVLNDLPTKSEHFVLQTRLSDDSVAKTCAGRVNSTSCVLVSAIAEYPVLVDMDGSIRIADTYTLSSPKIVQLANNTALSDAIIAKLGLKNKGGYTQTTLGGILMATSEKWSEVVGLLPENVTTGGLPIHVYGREQSAWTELQHMSSWRDCAPIWKDPRDLVMSWINGLMFYTGVYAAQLYNDTELKPMLDESARIRYNVTGYLQSPTNVFHSDMSYFAGAAMLQVFSILVILHTFHGWWRLEWRSGSLSFSPLDLAKAFDAPLLRETTSLRHVGNIVKHNGDLGVQYKKANRFDDLVYEDTRQSRSTGRMVFIEADETDSAANNQWSIKAFRK